jgi:hypothetical protein
VRVGGKGEDVQGKRGRVEEAVGASGRRGGRAMVPSAAVPEKKEGGLEKKHLTGGLHLSGKKRLRVAVR